MLNLAALFIYFLAILSSAYSTSVNAEGRTGPRNTEIAAIKSLCVNFSIDDRSYFPAGNITDNGMAAHEGQFAVFFAQELHFELQNTGFGELKMYGLSVRAMHSLGVPVCDGDDVIVAASIKPYDKSKGVNEITYLVSTPSKSKKFRFVSRKHYDFTCSCPQDPYGGVAADSQKYAKSFARYIKLNL